jgi:hypothetical protein
MAALWHAVLSVQAFTPSAGIAQPRSRVMTTRVGDETAATLRSKSPDGPMVQSADESARPAPGRYAIGGL